MLCFRVLTTAAPRRPIAATLPYFTPPLTTFYHFSPHLKLIAFLVKQNRAFLRIFFGKVFLRSSSNFTATSCVPVTCKSPQLAALFSRESMAPLRLCQRPMDPAGPIPRRYQNAKSRFQAQQAIRLAPLQEILFATHPSHVMLNPFDKIQGVSTHGMDRTSARRNRSQLRNRLLRQR